MLQLSHSLCVLFMAQLQRQFRNGYAVGALSF